MIGRVLVICALFALAACHSRPVREQPLPTAAAPVAPVESSPGTPSDDPNSVPNTDQKVQPHIDAASNVPACMPEPAKPKVAVRRRPQTVQEPEKTTLVETLPPRLGSATPEVKSIDASVGSILGRRLQGADGEDLGRVVDVQADGEGRVRLVIIEFGGFLGVGNRRAAIDWSLLRFHPDDPERSLTLSVGAKEVLATPEYRAASHPQALMAPTPPQLK